MMTPQKLLRIHDLLRMTRFLNIVFGILLGLLVCTGCRLGVTGGAKIRAESVAFIQPGTTTKPEVIDNLGQPSNIYADGKVFAYRWETGLHTTGPAYIPSGPPSAVHAAREGVVVQDTSTLSLTCKGYCIVFDATGTVLKSDWVTSDTCEEFEEAVRAFLVSPKR